MKTTILMLFMLIVGVTAQAQNVNPNAKPKKSLVRCDTVKSGGRIVLEQDVVQCTVTVVINGIIQQTKQNNGPFIVDLMALRPGMVVLCEEIVASPSPGLYVKRPARKFVVQ